MKFIVFAAASALALAACSDPQPRVVEQPVIQISDQSRAEMSRVNAARVTVPMPETLAEPVADAPDSETPGETAVPAEPAYDAGLVRVQTLLDRAHFSPGVIDGHDGENVRKAISAYQRAHNLAEDGRATEALLQHLERNDEAPALTTYVLTQADIDGPFAQVPSGLEAQSELDALSFQSAAEALAERFHMDDDLLRTLNPGVDFTRANVELVVANAGGELSGQVARIDIDKEALTLRAYDAAGQMLAFYPVTIGAGNTPRGELEITAIAFDPTYNYDADALPAFNDDSGRTFTIAPGPNNPVGLVWIALNAPSYGIHGTPNPELISKSSSRGCVRLTNWDAVELGRATQRGVQVRFHETTVAARRVAQQG